VFVVKSQSIFIPKRMYLGFRFHVCQAGHISNSKHFGFYKCKYECYAIVRHLSVGSLNSKQLVTTTEMIRIFRWIVY